MSPARDTYGSTIPRMGVTDLPGKIIVIEGTDGVGRSTQIALLKPWLEQQGRAVVDTGMTRSELAGKGIKQAKEGHTLGRITLTLFYASDFADRLEREIVPALRAGFVVLTDRYIYSLLARALVRDLDPVWVRNLYSFALKPDAVFYLRIGVEDLIPRVVFSTGFDYWESGMDLHSSEDMYESFRKYQTSLLSQFDKLAEEYKFDVIDATEDIRSIFEKLKRGISRVLEGKHGLVLVPELVKSGPEEPAQASDTALPPASSPKTGGRKRRGSRRSKDAAAQTSGAEREAAH